MTYKIAFIFPGQGAQAVGMGKDLYDNFECAKKVFNTADTVLGKSISGLCFSGPEESLKQTLNTQPAVVTMSIAAAEALKSVLNIKPDYTAGHSLGEYCAMYISGVMSLENTLCAVQKRAELMSEAKNGCMAAVLNADSEQLNAGITEGLKYGYVDIANYNSPVQTVITGDKNAVNTACDYMLSHGVRKVVPLMVSGAFHSKYMKNAGEKFKEFISKVELNNAIIPVITNIDAEITTNAEDFRLKMPKQICSSVHWMQTIEKAVLNGVNIFVEIGPGKVLAGLNRKINSEIKTYNVYDKNSLYLTAEALKSVLCGV